MATFTLTTEDYEALIALAQQGTLNPDGTVNQDKAIVLDTFLRKLEKDAGVTRSLLWIQWQDPVSPLPPGTLFPKTWPPELRYKLQLVTRAINKSDVLQVVQQRTPKAVNVLVTPDPAALVGWTPIDDFFLVP